MYKTSGIYNIERDLPFQSLTLLLPVAGNLLTSSINRFALFQQTVEEGAFAFHFGLPVIATVNPIFLVQSVSFNEEPDIFY